MKILFLFLLALPTISFSANFISLTSKPDVLELKKYRTVTGKLELRYIHESPRIVVRIGAGNKETNEFFEKLMQSDLVKLNCDGDFFPMFDQLGNQYLHVNSIKSCIDEDGDVVAHSINLSPLSDEQVNVSKKFIIDSMKPVTALVAPNVNDSSKPKEPVNPKGGIFSPKLGAKAVYK